MTEIHDKLERARRDLLDLGLRNTLLNYRHLKTRGVRIIDELSQEVFQILVSEGRSMSFEPARDLDHVEAEVGERFPELERLFASVMAEEEAPSGTSSAAARHRDTKLQTPYTAPRLQRRLINTAQAARSAIEEQGINILFLAMGMLEWYEAESSDLPRLAPLVLVPVSLVRSDVKSRFKLTFTGDELETNLSLQLKLATDFGISLPELAVSEEEIDVARYAEAVAKSIKRRDRWTVKPNEIALAFFSFSKLRMYKDLDSTSWPEGRKPEDDALIRDLFGDGFYDETPVPSEQRSLDERLTPDDLHQIQDADSSQTEALLAVRQGRHLVIQGPPGTGKSQTITNIIGEAIADKKSVLFVSEKMAALDVVKRRLDHVGIGDACVEIHSHRTNKRAFLKELEGTLQLGQPRSRRRAQGVAGLKEARDRLNAYAKAVNQPIGGSGVTPQAAYGYLLKLDEALPELPSPGIDSTPLISMSPEEYDSLAATVRELQALLGRMGTPLDHPFWGSSRRLYVPMTDGPEIRRAAAEARAHLQTLVSTGRELAQMFGDADPESLPEIETSIRTAELARNAPDLAGLDARSGKWRSQAARITFAIKAGQRIAEIRSKHEGVTIPQAWTVDLLDHRAVLAGYADKWWRFTSSQYRRVRSVVRGLCTPPAPKGPQELLELVDFILEVQDLQRTLDREEELLHSLCGEVYSGWETPWGSLTLAADFLRDVHNELEAGRIHRGLLEVVAGSRAPGEIVAILDPTVRAVESYVAAARLAADAIGIPETDDGVQVQEPATPFTFQEVRLLGWEERTAELQDIVTWNHAADLLNSAGLSTAVDLAAEWPHAADHLFHVLDYARYAGLLEVALAERPELASFDGQAHGEVANRFCDLDRNLLALNRGYIAATHWKGLPARLGLGQVGVLLHEFQKKTRHYAIRKLMSQAGGAIQAIKPVFMMSPLSVAAYLPPGSVAFDLVVFDEASQVRPVEALGAVLRGRQVIVVGDSRQLPPTAFWDKFGEVSDDEDDVQLTSDLESILGLFLAKGASQQMLRWHYRSRHDSLIAVSNHEFYDDRLFVFPSPERESRHLGLRYHHLTDTEYERGKAINRGEARAVASAVMAHARNRAHLTLGVASFSVAQKQAIEDELEVQRLNDTSCEGFFAAHPEEPFFVKNLENVQGDERDVVFISVGYGRTAEGYLSMNFGPLNKDGGERRLNVLITRARRRCEVFSNLTSADLDLARSSARGVVAFKTFLEYAQTGIMDVPGPTGEEPDSPFEEAVANALRRHGLRVDHQVGSGGFSVDLAVADPRRLGRYLLGIECDGASYHSAKWARDRDRLRQEVLEGLGWEIHRIWSTDWFRNPDRELQRTLERVEAAKIRSPQETEEDPAEGGGASTGSGGTEVEREEADLPIPEDLQAPEYVMTRMTLDLGGRDLHAVPSNVLADWLAEVVRGEGPIHLSQAAARVAAACGVQRVGRRIREAFAVAARLSARQGELQRRGDFLWIPKMNLPVVRDRGRLAPSARRIEHIAPEEQEEALLQVVRASVGIQPEQAITAAGRLLGYARVTDGIGSALRQAARRLLRADRLRLESGFLVASEPDTT